MSEQTDRNEIVGSASRVYQEFIDNEFVSDFDKFYHPEYELILDMITESLMYGETYEDLNEIFGMFVAEFPEYYKIEDIQNSNYTDDEKRKIINVLKNNNIGIVSDEPEVVTNGGRKRKTKKSRKTKKNCRRRKRKTRHRR